MLEKGAEFDQVVQLLSRTLENQELVNPTGEAVLSVISEYARSWSLLQGYDELSLGVLTAKQVDMQALNLEDAIEAISQ